MQSRWLTKLCLALALTGISFQAIALSDQSAPAQSPEAAAGAALYAQHCAECHDNPQGRIPARFVLSLFKSPDNIADALTSGVMRPMAKGLDAGQIRSIAVFLTGRAPGADPKPDLHANMCKDPGGPIDLAAPAWNGWGRDVENSRFQPEPGLKTEDISRLKLKWAFAYPGTAYGQPIVVGEHLFITTRNGQVFSLDAATGCTRWVSEIGVPTRAAISVGALPAASKAKFAAWVADEKGTVHALDAMTGQPLWSTLVDSHPMARITGAPKLYQGRLYVPVSSLEEASAATPKYSCCTFRGSVVALDAATGKIVWKTYTIPKKAVPIGLNAMNVQMYGPAGVGVWDSPTIDTKRKLVYIGTGDSYTDVPTDASDAVMAFDLETGARKWVTQVLAHDDYTVGCRQPGRENCPKNNGPDFDFGASPILHTLPNGKQIILAGAKSGVVYGFDPDDHGKMLWQHKVGEGSDFGAILWGMATEDTRLYVGLGDVPAKLPYKPGGIFALDAATGDTIWHTPAPPPVCAWGTQNCLPAQPGAVTAVPGAIFAGSWDAHERAYSATDGAIIWDFDTGQTFDAVNGVKAHGGTIDMGSQTIAGGTLFVNSGITLAIHPGNALLAFTVDGK